MRTPLSNIRASLNSGAFSRSLSLSRAHRASATISLNLQDTGFLYNLEVSSKQQTNAHINTKSSHVANFRNISENAPSSQLQCTLSHSAEKPTEEQIISSQIKQKINQMINEHNYDDILEALVVWTLPDLSITWNNVLTRDELSYLVGILVTHQSKLLTKANSYKLSKDSSESFSASHKAAHRYKKLIRQIFANLLNLDGHLYTKRLETHFDLHAKDYENIINLELRNGKLDLASRWFKNMELQYPNGQHYLKMTRELWILKFKVLGGAQSLLWVVEGADLNGFDFNIRESFLVAETLWMHIFEEFSKYQVLLLGSSKIVFDKQLVCAMINSVAYSKNTQQVFNIVQQNWGILLTGKMVAGFQKPSEDDPLYPDIDVLSTIVVALIFNQDFRAALAFVNGFQVHYDIDLQSSKVFWDYIFRWSDSVTRFKEYRALQIYLKDTKCASVVPPTNESNLYSALKHAQSSPEFDYEGYLDYVTRLRARRLSLFKELWRCYRECVPGFSTRPFQTYLTLIRETRDERLCYDLLSALSHEWNVYLVSELSFNKLISSEITSRIEHEYSKTIKLLLNIKGEAGAFSALQLIVDEWSLNEAMRTNLEEWLATRMPYYTEAVKTRELRERLDQEKEQQETEDDQLLNIF